MVQIQMTPFAFVGQSVAAPAPPAFRPAFAALAAGFAAASLVAHTYPPEPGSILLLLRAALSAGWFTFVLSLLAQETRKLLSHVVERGVRTSDHQPSVASEEPLAFHPSSLIRRLRLAALQPFHPQALTAGAPETDQRLTWPQIVRRATLVTAVAMPRFLAEPAGYLVASVWLIAFLVCGYVYLEALWDAKRCTAYWIGAAVLLAPWGLGLVTAWWPAFDCC